MFFRFPSWKYFRYNIEERWERLAVKQLAFREWINNNPRIMIGITAVCVVVFLAILIGQLMPDKAPKIEGHKKAWFYDLNTGELFIAKSDKLSPIKAPSGQLPNGEPAGVKAYVFSYAHEPNESNRFIGFLETLTPETKKNMPDFLKSRANITRESIKQWNRGRLIRRVSDGQWYTADSNEARAIMKEVFRANENGETARYCPPE